MIIVESSSGHELQVEVVPIENDDFTSLNEERYFFDWASEMQNEIFKLRIVGASEILGLVSLERIPSELRVHVSLLTVSKENVGSSKKYKNIAGNLLAHVAKVAVLQDGENACFSLRPKTELVQHYVEEYNMSVTGVTLSMIVPEILELIKRFDHE